MIKLTILSKDVVLNLKGWAECLSYGRVLLENGYSIQIDPGCEEKELEVMI